MEPRGRGRGYGRARGQQTGASGGGQPRGGGAPGGGAVPRQVQPPQSAWARPPQPTGGGAWARPQGPPQQMPAQPPQQQPSGPASVGRGARQQQERVGLVTGSGSGEEAQRGVGSGAVRGRVVRKNEIVFTKPDNMPTKQGTSGRPIQLTTNFFELSENSGWTLYRYRVDFTPDVDHTGTRKKLIRTATREVFANSGFLFEGTLLYSPRVLHDSEMSFCAATDGGEPIQIQLRSTGAVSKYDFSYLQVFNIIVRKCLMLMNLQQVGRHFYDPSGEIKISDHNLLVWPGYFTSMRQHEQKILLNVDLQSKVMRMDTCYDALNSCDRSNFKKEFTDKIIGVTVLTKYNNKTYRIDDVDFNSSPQSTFKTADGSQISYKDYYLKKYNVNIRDLTQPMLVSRSKPREIRVGMPEIVYLVPELCVMTGLSDKQRENFHLMKALADYTRIGVKGRVDRLLRFSRIIHSKPEVMNELKRWDLKIKPELVRVQGRQLKPESIISGGNLKTDNNETADWTRTVRDKPMFASSRIRNFAVITPSKFGRATDDFVATARKAARGMHWDLGNVKVFSIQDDRTSTYLRQIENVLAEFQPDMMMIVLPSQTSDRYNALKKKCCVDRAIPVQMIVARNLTSKGVMSIATKVVIQINCKVGGAPWTVPIPLSGLMVVGYDVCRDTQNKSTSFAGMVATMDKNLTRYFSLAFPHMQTQEISNNFGAFLILACKEFQKNNGSLPERILIYRDGVGEGQLIDVKELEIKSIKDKLKEVYGDRPYKFGFVVVSKRINTRFFYGDNNPPPGTVVDDVVTLPERYDFYLISQCVRQGTVSPTSYNVLEDTLGLGPDKLQMLTYKLTHMYYNWSGTVRVPSPCQNAHKLAFLTSQALHTQAHTDLSHLLYYM